MASTKIKKGVHRVQDSTHTIIGTTSLTLGVASGVSIVRVLLEKVDIHQPIEVLLIVAIVFGGVATSAIVTIFAYLLITGYVNRRNKKARKSNGKKV